MDGWILKHPRLLPGQFLWNLNLFMFSMWTSTIDHTEVASYCQWSAHYWPINTEHNGPNHLINTQVLYTTDHKHDDRMPCELFLYYWPFVPGIPLTGFHGNSFCIRESYVQYQWPGISGLVQETSVKSLSKFMHFHSRKCIWICHLEKCGHFISTSMCYMLM